MRLSESALDALLKVLVHDGTVVDYHEPVRILFRTLCALDVPFSHQLTVKYGCTPFDALSSVIDELHVAFIKLDAVGHDVELCRSGDDVVVEAALLERVVLHKTGLVDKVHGLFDVVLDVLFIRCQVEEQLMEAVDVCLDFDIECNLGVRLFGHEGDVPRKYIDFLPFVLGEDEGVDDHERHHDHGTQGHRHGHDGVEFSSFVKLFKKAHIKQCFGYTR